MIFGKVVYKVFESAVIQWLELLVTTGSKGC